MKKRKPTYKRLGEYAQVCFMQRALALDISVAVPYGDSDPFDSIAIYGRHTWRIQVRSAWRRYKGGDRYSISSRFMQGKRYFRPAEIDFLAVYIVPCDVWYIIPVREIRRCKSLQVIPHRPTRGSRWEKFREAWRLLKQA